VGKLFLYLNGIAYEIREQRVTVSHWREGASHRLELTIDKTKTTLHYHNDQTPVASPFYTEDEEDVDFGVWLSRVLGSEQRQQIFVQSWRVFSRC
jgi:hypothetical protein